MWPTTARTARVCSTRGPHEYPGCLNEELRSTAEGALWPALRELQNLLSLRFGELPGVRMPGENHRWSSRAYEIAQCLNRAAAGASVVRKRADFGLRVLRPGRRRRSIS